MIRPVIEEEPEASIDEEEDDLSDDGRELDEDEVECKVETESSFTR